MKIQDTGGGAMKKIFSTLVLILAIFGLVTSSFADVSVRGHLRKNPKGGWSWVSPHWRSDPDGNPFNNWSFPGNVNPHTGKVAPGNPDTYLRHYYNRNR